MNKDQILELWFLSTLKQVYGKQPADPKDMKFPKSCKISIPSADCPKVILVFESRRFKISSSNKGLDKYTSLEISIRNSDEQALAFRILKILNWLRFRKYAKHSVIFGKFDIC